MTHLRKMMLDELQRRNYAQKTVRAYISAVESLPEYFHRPPDQLGPGTHPSVPGHLFRDRKLAADGPSDERMAALRFFFVKTLKRPYLRDDIPYPKGSAADARQY